MIAAIDPQVVAFAGLAALLTSAPEQTRCW
jgi:hypothetical protein